MFVCLFGFFFFVIIAFLHQNPHLQSDIANFNPWLSTPHLISLSGLQSARSTGVSLGSAEKAKAQGEASVGAGDRRKQRRLHFNLFIRSKEWEICPMSRDTEMFRTRQAQPCFSALLVCGDMGTIVSGCFVPSTTLVFLQLLEVWWSCGSFPTLIILRLYDFTPDSSATLLEKAQELVKAWWNGNKDLQGRSNSQNQQFHRSVGMAWNNWKRRRTCYSIQLHIPALNPLSFCSVSCFASSCTENLEDAMSFLMSLKYLVK